MLPTNGAASGRPRPDGPTGPAHATGRASAAVTAFLTGGTAGVSEQQLSVRHLTQVDLARRWRMSERTLERWRWLGQGPAFLKIGGRVAYRMEDILSYEATRLRSPACSHDPFFRRTR